MTADGGTLTPSLRRRVVIAVLGLLTVLLVLLGITIDVLIGAQAGRDLHDRLMASASRADALTEAGAPPAQLAAEVNGGGIRALLVTADGTTYGDPGLIANPTGELPPPVPPPRAPPPPGAPGPPPPPRPPRDATATVIEHRLTDGSRLVLVADTTATTALLRQLRTIMVVSGIAVLVLAAGACAVLVHAAMRPLNRLTDVAESIAGGDRGRRLNPDRPTTELGRAAAAFDTMVNALESSEANARTAALTAARAEESTRRFLADAAHELRTPVAGIHAGAEQIVSAASQDDDTDSARQRHRAELVLAEARRAGRLVADMLDLSRIDAGVPLERQVCDLVSLAEAERARTAMLAPSVEVTVTGVPSLTVSADPVRVGQILANVTDNARRHTPPGGSMVIDVDGDRSHARITITDSGSGVADGDRDRIFERLVRLDDARDRDRGGAGLGLSIARAHGGELMNLPCETGARFRLTLPR
ncbi:sensor histidine kinase [Mycolicibacterium lacusdiani]|uniref:sensor histidine kinase n=1 Tax=Mycolicibacterium lacusdiani TaxID=2895283 RepID=UPI001F32B7FC|nr:HAMP domain-containing sensor histidine kinase [Mycolicibacterium lacusdiani]